MVALPEVRKVADCNTSGGGNTLIPEGQYQAVIVKSEMSPTKDKQGQYLALTVVITQGQYKNTEFIERLNLVNKNQQAVDIAFNTLASISKAFGMETTPKESSDLHNKPLMIEIKNKKSNDWINNDGVSVEGKMQSEVKKYLPLPKTGVPEPVAQESAPAPTEAVNPATAEAPAANPFAA